MLTYLARRLYPLGSVRTVLRGPVRGMRVVVDRGIGVSYLFGMDQAAPRFFSRVIQPGMTVVDVGANKGQMALLFAALVGEHGAVVAWEPAPAEFLSLQRNLALNARARVTAIAAAASDRTGTMAFSYDAGHPTQGKLAGVEPSYRLEGADVVTVETRPLDSLLEQGIVPDVVKIDAEGAAAAVLRGAARTIERVGPAFYVELHGPEEQAAIGDLLLSRGYSARTLDGMVVADPAAGWFSPLWCTRPRPSAQPREAPAGAGEKSHA